MPVRGNGVSRRPPIFSRGRGARQLCRHPPVGPEGLAGFEVEVDCLAVLRDYLAGGFWNPRDNIVQSVGEGLRPSRLSVATRTGGSRNPPLFFGVASLFAENDEFDPAIHAPALVGVVRGDRFVLAPADGNDPRGVYPAIPYEVSLHRIGSLF